MDKMQSCGPVCPCLNGRAQRELCPSEEASLARGPISENMAVFVGSHTYRARQMTYVRDMGQNAGNRKGWGFWKLETSSWATAQRCHAGRWLCVPRYPDWFVCFFQQRMGIQIFKNP